MKLAEYARVIMLCPVCPLFRCFDAPWHENLLCQNVLKPSQAFDLADFPCCTLPLCQCSCSASHMRLLKLTFH